MSGRNKFFIALGIAAALAFVFLFFHFRWIQKRTEVEVERQQHPERRVVKLESEFLDNVFKPRKQDGAWFSDTRKILDAQIIDGGVLAVSDGGVIFAGSDRDVRIAGRSTSLPFTAGRKILRLRDQTLIVGATGFLAIKEREFAKEPSAYAYSLAEPQSAKLVDGIVEGGEAYVLSEKGDIFLWEKRSLEKVCSHKSGVAVALAKIGNRFYVGYVEGNLFELKPSGETCEAREIAGLTGASEIRTLAASGRRLWIGTSGGLYALDDREARQVRGGLMVTSILPIENGAEFGTFSGEVFRTGEERPLRRFPGGVFSIRDHDGSRTIGTGEGAFQIDWRAQPPSPEPLFPAERLKRLSENYVTALAFDGANILVGGLNTGLMRLDPLSGALTPVVPDEPGISAIALLSDGRFACAATTGLIELEKNEAVRRKLSKKDGLIHENVTSVIADGDRLYAGTAAGLSLIAGSRVRSIYAFHGLVNNHLYALAPAPGGVWVGTLGGLCLVGGADGLTVRRCWTESDGLTHPWVSALAVRGDRLFIGTYGGGVMSLDQDGKLVQLDGFRKASINLGAAALVGRLVCFGSLENGVLCTEKGDRLFPITSGLPGTNVTALAASEQRVAVGTDAGLIVLPVESFLADESE